MNSTKVKLGDLICKSQGSVNPKNFTDEMFELYSIPAYDKGAAAIVCGADIGSTKQIVSPNNIMISKIIPHIRRAWVVDGGNGYRKIASGEWIVFDNPKLHPAYFRHYLLSDEFHNQFMKTVSGVGGSLLRAKPSLVSEFTLQLPPIKEQQRIAAILDKANDIKRKREEAIATLDVLVQSAFFDILNSCEDVENYSIKDIVKKYTPKPGNESDAWSLSLEQIEGGSGKILNIVKVAKSKLGTSTYYFERHAILYSKLRPYLNKVAIPEANGYATSELVPLYCDESRVLPNYLATYLRSGKFVAFANTNSGGAKMPRVMMDKFWAHEIPLPPISQQNKFEEIYSKCKNLRNQYQIELKSIDELLFSLQTQAFTTGFNA